MKFDRFLHSPVGVALLALICAPTQSIYDVSRASDMQAASFADINCSAKSALNVRPPLVRAVVSKGGIDSHNFFLRQGSSPASLAADLCNQTYTTGRCNEKQLASHEQNILDILAQHQSLSSAERALDQVTIGWQLLHMHNELVESKLQFAHALAAFPRSGFILREFTSSLLLSSTHTFYSVNRGPNFAWAYKYPLGTDKDVGLLEGWETFAAVRFAAPHQSLEEEDWDLVRQGIPIYKLVPSNEWNDFKLNLVFRRNVSPQVIVHRLQHDIQLIEALQSRGLLSEAMASSARAAYREVLDFAPRPAPNLVEPRDHHWRLLWPYFNRRLYVHPCPSLQGQATAQSEWIIRSYRTGFIESSLVGGALSDGSVLVIDNLLTPQALQSMRDFAELSTIFFQERRSYLGATKDSGFATPLIAQISSELRKAFPEFLCDLILGNHWAYKFDDKLETGIQIHADSAAINVNLWITPDEFNLDSSSGGLVIYDAVARNLSFDEYNTHSTSSKAVENLLHQTDFRNITVPYKQNRAIIFDSSRFHATQSFTFQRGSVTARRINLTFLYGPQGGYCSLKAASV